MVRLTNSPGNPSVIATTALTLDIVARGGGLFVLVGATKGVVEFERECSGFAAISRPPLVPGHDSSGLGLESLLVITGDRIGSIGRAKV